MQTVELAETKLEARTPLVPQLTEILRRRIISTELPPGATISESEIAREFSMSRQPVREAFIKLAESGLLEVRPQRRTRVAKISTARVMDARFVREAIEADVVRLLAERLAARPDPDLISALGELVERQRAAADAGAAPAFFPLDEAFHRRLAEAAGRPTAWSVIEGIKSQMDRVRYLSTFHFPMSRLVRQHAAIVDALSRGAPDDAAAEMRAHLREILGDLPAIAASRPDYFERDAHAARTEPY